MLPTPRPDSLLCGRPRPWGGGGDAGRVCSGHDHDRLPHPPGRRAQTEGSQHALADLEMGVLCLAGGVPGPSSCSISGSVTEGCSGAVVLLPWSVEWVLAGSRWELGTEGRRSKEQPAVPGRPQPPPLRC